MVVPVIITAVRMFCATPHRDPNTLGGLIAAHAAWHSLRLRHRRRGPVHVDDNPSRAAAGAGPVPVPRSCCRSSC
jgi:hypothetical protein